MGETRSIRPARALRGALRAPGDKSISHRAAMLAGLGGGPVKICNFLEAADCLSTLRCMRALGVRTARTGPAEWVVEGNGMRGLTEPETVLDAGNSGTTLRLLMGILAAQPFFSAFGGDASLSRRPLERVVEPLSRMGARIGARRAGSRLPAAILPAGPLRGIDYQMPMASAQVKSAVLLAGLYARGRTVVTEPYQSRDHTERMLETFGATVERCGATVAVEPAAALRAPDRLVIPGDISSAAFWLVAASVIPGSDLTIENVGVNPTRAGIIDVLRRMGARITLRRERLDGREPAADIEVAYAPRLRGVVVTADETPRLIDEIPALAAAALFADGVTAVEGAGELRVKETDRLRAIAVECRKIGGRADETADGLVIHGGDALRPAVCSSYGDHRMAMAMAVAGAAAAGAVIEDPDCVGISYPEFYTELERFAAE